MFKEYSFFDSVCLKVHAVFTDAIHVLENAFPDIVLQPFLRLALSCFDPHTAKQVILLSGVLVRYLPPLS